MNRNLLIDTPFMNGCLLGIEEGVEQITTIFCYTYVYLLFTTVSKMYDATKHGGKGNAKLPKSSSIKHDQKKTSFFIRHHLCFVF